MVKRYVILISFLLILNGFLTGFSGEIGMGEEKDIELDSHNEEKLNYAERDPIRINGDEDFHEQAEAKNWIGDGSKENPYIISRYEINGSGEGYCIYIGNTTVHFKLKNNYFHNASGGGEDYYFRNRGIFLNNVDNGVIANNIVSNNERNGIDFNSVRQSKIENNTILNNGWDGIHLYYSLENRILNNDILKNDWGGIRVSQSIRNVLRNNTASKNARQGVSIEISYDNLLAENVISENQKWGFRLYYSSNNVIKGNTILENEEWGGNLERSDDNLIYHNRFINNHNQTYDDGNNNWDAGNPEKGDKGGNYWSDYDGEDRGDGIGYEAYKIEGDMNQDNYPWVTPNMVHPMDSFEVHVENITASYSPIITITNAYDIHSNPTNGEYRVKIGIEDSLIITNLTFREGHTEYNWNEKNITGEYTVNVTIDEITKSDNFHVNPLRIEGNPDFIDKAEEEEWPGNGSKENPYIISGYNIKNHEHNYSLYLSNITLHFELRNNSLNSTNINEKNNDRDTGITLIEVKNGKIINNTISNHGMGINLEHSDNNTLLNNEIKFNMGRNGVSLYESNFNVIKNNIILENKEWGLYIDDSNYNLIYQNQFIENKNQVNDNADNHWNTNDPIEGGKGGNYWSDYENQDRSDGVGEEPYEIPGNNNKDNYPWITPKRGRLSFEVNIEDIKAGEKPVIMISNSEDQYCNELSGDYRVEIIINGDIVKTNLTFENGYAEFRTEELTESGQYNVDIYLYDVIPSKESESFYVNPSNVDRIKISPTDDSTIKAGVYLEFSVEAIDHHGNLITDSSPDFEWQNTDIYGIFFSTKAGEYDVYASYDDVMSDQVTVTVEPGRPDYIEIKPESAIVIEGESISYNAIVYDQFNNKIDDVTNETEWSISEEADGGWTENRYTSEKIGLWRVTARYEGIENSALLRVEEDLTSSYLWLILLFLVVTMGSIFATRFL